MSSIPARSNRRSPRPDDNDTDARARTVTVTFWGVRGSIPSPGRQTARYGGNTSCVSIEGVNVVDGLRRIGILDAGTGVRALGQTLLNDDVEIIFLLSHTHWDHIQGFPFFAPLYQENRTIYLSRLEERKGLFEQLLQQMDGTHFPLTQAQIGAKLESLSEVQLQQFVDSGYRVTRIRANHPGEAWGFRADLQSCRIVYMPDNELVPPYVPITSMDALADFCRNADVLIHDSQYLESERQIKSGWGHSVIGDVCELALRANVKHLVLFHHDPDRTDAQIDQIQTECRAFFASRGSDILCTAAYEGMQLIVPA